MEKEIKEVLTHTVSQCDVCDYEMDSDSLTEKCYICGRDLCYKHRVYGHFHENGTRWNQIYCTICWEAGKDIRSLIEHVEKEAFSKIENLEKLWYDKAMLFKLNH